MTSESELDKLVQIYATQKRSAISFIPAEAGHHIISRSVFLLRYDPQNIMPVTLEEHNNIHAGKINAFDYISKTRREYLESRKNKNFKDYLIQNGMTKKEFLEICKETLLEQINDSKRKF